MKMTEEKDKQMGIVRSSAGGGRVAIQGGAGKRLPGRLSPPPSLTSDAASVDEIPSRRRWILRRVSARAACDAPVPITHGLRYGLPNHSWGALMRTLLALLALLILSGPAWADDPPELTQDVVLTAHGGAVLKAPAWRLARTANHPSGRSRRLRAR